MGLVGSTALVAGVGFLFWRQLRDFRDPLVPWQEDASVLLSTDWGLSWRLMAIGALVTVAAFACAASDGRGSEFRRAAWIVASSLAGLMCAFPAFNGHAAATEGLRWISIPADIVHVLAAGSWIGGLFFVLIAELRERRQTGRGNALLAEVLPLFSQVALISGALLVGTGALASWLHVASLDAMVSTRYGRILLTKIGLVVIVMILGAVNWRVLTPKLWGVGGARPLRRNAIRELTVAHLVILVAAMLVRTSPLEG
ncbi:MAG: CopD family protein [Gammaproteobacteria bacterium]|nr:CopD family protein [Gammaproteobacteria bacterium]